MLQVPQRAGDVPATQLHVKVILFGNAGTGKTTAAARAPRPLIVLTEPQAIPHIRAANPDAEYIVVENTAQVREVVSLFRAGTPQGDGTLRVRWPLPGGKVREAHYRTLVLDSFGDWQRLAIKERIAMTAGKEILSTQDWQVVIAQTDELARTLRDMQCHVIQVFHAEEIVVEERRYVRLSVSGRKLPNTLAGYVNVVAYAFKKAGESADGQAARSLYLALTDGNEQFLTKAHGAIPPVCLPDFPAWFRAVTEFKLAASLALPVSPAEIPAEADLKAAATGGAEPNGEAGADTPDLGGEAAGEKPESATTTERPQAEPLAPPLRAGDVVLDPATPSPADVRPKPPKGKDGDGEDKGSGKERGMVTAPRRRR